MILYIENPKDDMWKPLELINEFGKAAEYKINAEKSLAFLCTSKERSETEIEETIPLIIATRRIKYLGISLCKEAKELYTENYKTLMKEIKDDINRWRDITCMFLGRKNKYCENDYTPNAIYRFNAILSNYQWHLSQN